MSEIQVDERAWREALKAWKRAPEEWRATPYDVLEAIDPTAARYLRQAVLRKGVRDLKANATAPAIRRLIGWRLIEHSLRATELGQGIYETHVRAEELKRAKGRRASRARARSEHEHCAPSRGDLA